MREGDHYNRVLRSAERKTDHWPIYHYRREKQEEPEMERKMYRLPEDRSALFGRVLLVVLAKKE